jgi:hypothetical protein
VLWNPDRQWGEYPIELSRIDSAEKVLEWVLHLTGKDWIRREHFELLVSVAIEQGAKIDRTA